MSALVLLFLIFVDEKLRKILLSGPTSSLAPTRGKLAHLIQPMVSFFCGSPRPLQVDAPWEDIVEGQKSVALELALSPPGGAEFGSFATRHRCVRSARARFCLKAARRTPEFLETTLFAALGEPCNISVFAFHSPSTRTRARGNAASFANEDYNAQVFRPSLKEKGKYEGAESVGKCRRLAFCSASSWRHRWLCWLCGHCLKQHTTAHIKQYTLCRLRQVDASVYP